MSLAVELDSLIDTHEAARLLGIKSQTLVLWRTTGRGPRFVRLESRAIRYRRQDVLDYIERRTSGAGPTEN